VSPVANVLVRGFNAFSGLATKMAAMKPLPPDVAAGLTAPYDSWKNRIATLRFVQDIPMKPGDPSWDAVVRTEEGLAKLAGLPILVCWGQKDFVFDDHFLAEWRRRFPAAQYHVFPDAGHYVLEDKADEVVALVKDFLAKHPLAVQASAP
jgi:haloalkane dehalogenase